MVHYRRHIARHPRYQPRLQRQTLREHSALDYKCPVPLRQLNGIQIVRKSLEAPLRQLVDNAGMEGSLVVEKVKAHKGSYGYNVLTQHGGHNTYYACALPHAKIAP